MIENISNENLEQQIAAFYWEAYRVSPGTPVRETGVLSELWDEFDRRVYEGTIEVE